jgi:hypothetical protein
MLLAKPKYAHWQAIVTILFVICAILGVIAEWPQINAEISSITNNLAGQGTGLTCNSNATSGGYGTLYVASDVFCITNGQNVTRNFTVNNYNNAWGYKIGLNGSYSSSADTELYVLNPIQYGEFLAENTSIKNYTWYSGVGLGSVINVKNLANGQTYYVIFYTKSSTPDYISIGAKGITYYDNYN